MGNKDIKVNHNYRILHHTLSRTLSFAAALILLSACGGGSGSGSDLAGTLKETTNMPAEAADCIAELADKELTAAQQEFMIAGMRKDSERTEALRNELSFTELTAAGMFMVSAATRCEAPIQ